MLFGCVGDWPWQVNERNYDIQKVRIVAASERKSQTPSTQFVCSSYRLLDGRRSHVTNSVSVTQEVEGDSARQVDRIL
jgi:hypothetical protein